MAPPGASHSNSHEDSQMGTTSSSYESVGTPSESTTTSENDNENVDEDKDLDENGVDEDKVDEGEVDEDEVDEDEVDNDEGGGQNAPDIAAWREEIYTPGLSGRKGVQFETIHFPGL